MKIRGYGSDEMNIIIKRGRKNGMLYCKFYDTTGEEITDLGSVSKILTGATECNPYNGIFVGGQRGAAKQVVQCNFEYGHIRKMFDFPVIDFEHDDVLTIEHALKERIWKVKEWIGSTEWEEELEFSV
jgi:hypothetical protein